MRDSVAMRCGCNRSRNKNRGKPLTSSHGPNACPVVIGAATRKTNKSSALRANSSVRPSLRTSDDTAASSSKSPTLVVAHCPMKAEARAVGHADEKEQSQPRYSRSCPQDDRFVDFEEETAPEEQVTVGARGRSCTYNEVRMSDFASVQSPSECVIRPNAYRTHSSNDFRSFGRRHPH